LPEGDVHDKQSAFYDPQRIESQPFRYGAACQHFVDGYRTVGLPE